MKNFLLTLAIGLLLFFKTGSLNAGTMKNANHRILAGLQLTAVNSQIDTATGITFYSAILNGAVDPAGLPTKVSFEFGTDTTYGYMLTPNPDTLTGTGVTTFTADAIGIAPGKTYHFRVRMENSAGIFFGQDKSFSTLAAPEQNFTFRAGKCINQAGSYVDLGISGMEVPMPDFDNSNSAPVDIGFNFSFAGASFNQFIINSNGFIKLGTLHPADSVQFFTSPDNSLGGIFQSVHFADVFLVSPFNHHLEPGNGTPEFRVFTTGETGSRTCIIQFKNLREKIEPPLRQFDNIEFQIKLHETTNVVEFSYGTWQPSAGTTEYRMAAVGLKGTASSDNQILTVHKLSFDEWLDASFQSGNYCQACNAFNYGHLPRPIPDPGHTFVFYPKQAHDATITSIYTLGKLPVPFGLPHTPSAYIRNTGSDTLYNIPVNLAITGSNLFGGYATIPVLKPDSGMEVSFPGFSPEIPGFDSVTVTIPPDDFNNDNLSTFIQEITTNKFSYSDTIPFQWGLGFTYIGAPGSPSGLWLAKYHVTGIKNIFAARIGLGGGDGQSVYAVLLNSNGQIIGQSANYLLTEENSWQYHLFEFPNPPLVNNADFYIGLAQTQSSTTYYPLGIQSEDPMRRYAYYTAQLGGSGITESSGGVRYCIEAVLDSSFCQPVFGYNCSHPDYGQYINNFTTTGGSVNISNPNSGCSNSNSFSYYPDKTASVEKGTPFSFTAEGVNLSWYSGIALWADWNNDGDFYDTLELAHQGGYLTPGQFSGTIFVPISAITGTVRMRVLLYNTYTAEPLEPCKVYVSGEAEDYSLNILPPTQMVYDTSYVFQCDTTRHVTRGSVNAPVVGLRIDTRGVLNPMIVNSLSITSSGCTDFSHDVSTVKVYFTGSDSIFTTNHLFGTSTHLSAPVSGQDTLSYGPNYFWIVYDVADTATIGNKLDAACTRATFAGGGSCTPSITNPPGALTINYCIPEFAYANSGCTYGYGINSVVTSNAITNFENIDSWCPENPYDYTLYSNLEVSAEQGSTFQLFANSTGDWSLFYIFADWNRDFDFDDPGELVYSANALELTTNIVVPLDAVPGESRLRILSYWEELKTVGLGDVNSTSPGCPLIIGGGETEDYKLSILPGTPMNYSSAEVFQYDSLPPIQRGSLNNPVIGIRIITTGNLAPVQLTSLNLSSAGSDDFDHDVSQVKVFYSGGDSAFSTTHLFGSAADLSAPVTGSIPLLSGKNFFWVTFDARDTAVIGHKLDCSCNGVTINNSGSYVPDPPSPEGNQRIDYCIPTFTTHACVLTSKIEGFSTTGGATNISNPDNGCPVNQRHDYSRYTNMAVTARQGSTFQFNATGGGHLAVYIDWNGDFDFSEGDEMVSYNQLSGTITVPGDAIPGTTRLRLIMFFWPGPGTPPGGCGSRPRGETEDYSITILPSIPETISLQNLNIFSGQDSCFGATQSITLAGNGTTFEVQQGGSVTLIAGQSIHFLPYTNVVAGGYLSGMIAPSGPWCQAPPLPSAPSTAVIAPAMASKTSYNLFPNPTTGNFTLLVQSDEKTGEKIVVEIYDQWGKKLSSVTMIGASSREFSLLDKPKGIYLIRVINGNEPEMLKIIRQ